MVNVFVRDLDLGVVDHLDARRLEVVADGLPLFGGAQLVMDTTLVSAILQDGTPRRGRGLLFSKPAEGKQGRTQNSLARAVGLVWWCWRAKPEVGDPRQHRSCLH